MLLQQRLQIGRRDVLAAGSDDQLLLAVDDAKVALIVDLADVPGVQPAVGIDRIGRLLRFFVIPAHQVPATEQHLSVVGDLHLNARIRDTHGPVLDSIERVIGRSDRALGHAPTLPQQYTNRLEELDHLRVDGCRSRDGPFDLFEPDLGLDRHPHRSRALGGRKQLWWRLLLRLLQLDQLAAGFDRLKDRTAALLIRIGLDAGSERRLQLLPHARHADQEGWFYLCRIREELGWIRAEISRRLLRGGSIVTDEALEHVREGQIGDVAMPGPVEEGPR